VNLDNNLFEVASLIVPITDKLAYSVASSKQEML